MADISGNDAAQPDANVIRYLVPVPDDSIELRRFELQQRYLFYRHCVTAGSILIGLILVPRCLTVLRDMVVPFAGEETVVDARIAVSLTIAVSVVITGLVAKLRALKKLADRERERADELAARLARRVRETPTP